MSENTSQEEDDYITNSAKTRWEGLASVITGLVFFALVVLLVGAALGVLSLGAISQAWFMLFSLVIVSALVWLYGEKAVKFAAERMGK